MIKLYNFDELRPEEILNRDIRAEKNVEDVVDGIIADVRARGDEALKDYALKFDGAKIDALQVTPSSPFSITNVAFHNFCLFSLLLFYCIIHLKSMKTWLALLDFFF